MPATRSGTKRKTTLNENETQPKQPKRNARAIQDSASNSVSKSNKRQPKQQKRKDNNERKEEEKQKSTPDNAKNKRKTKKNVKANNKQTKVAQDAARIVNEENKANEISPTNKDIQAQSEEKAQPKNNKKGRPRKNKSINIVEEDNKVEDNEVTLSAPSTPLSINVQTPVKEKLSTEYERMLMAQLKRDNKKLRMKLRSIKKQTSNESDDADEEDNDFDSDEIEEDNSDIEETKQMKRKRYTKEPNERIMDKELISKFDGNNENASDWMRNYETIASAYGIKRPEKQFALFVKPNSLASLWLDSLNEDQKSNWNVMKKLFTKRFVLQDAQLQRKFAEESKLNSDAEDVTTYWTRLKANNMKLPISKRFPDSYLVIIFIEELKKLNALYEYVFVGFDETFEKALKMAQNVERELNNKKRIQAFVKTENNTNTVQTTSTKSKSGVNSHSPGQMSKLLERLQMIDTKQMDIVAQLANAQAHMDRQNMSQQQALLEVLQKTVGQSPEGNISTVGQVAMVSQGPQQTTSVVSTNNGQNIMPQFVDDNQSQGQYRNRNNSSKGSCYFCGLKGHYQKECRKRKRYLANQTQLTNSTQQSVDVMGQSQVNQQIQPIQMAQPIQQNQKFTNINETTSNTQGQQQQLQSKNWPREGPVVNAGSY